MRSKRYEVTENGVTQTHYATRIIHLFQFIAGERTYHATQYADGRGVTLELSDGVVVEIRECE